VVYLPSNALEEATTAAFTSNLSNADTGQSLNLFRPVEVLDRVVYLPLNVLLREATTAAFTCYLYNADLANL
jgi:hypothetical protein